MSDRITFSVKNAFDKMLSKHVKSKAKINPQLLFTQPMLPEQPKY